MACHLIGGKGNILPSHSESAVSLESVRHPASVPARKAKAIASQPPDGQPTSGPTETPSNPAAAGATRAQGQKRKKDSAPSQPTSDHEEPELQVGAESKRARKNKEVSTVPPWPLFRTVSESLTSIFRAPTHPKALLRGNS